MPTSLSHRAATLVLLAVIVAAAGSSLTWAESESTTIRIHAGQMLEIGTDTASPKSQFSWILTRDRKFESAQRTRFFQTRPAQPGSYVLDVSVQDPLASQNDYRAFSIIVTEPDGTAGAVPEMNGPPKAILVTDPPTMDGTAYLSPDGGIITLDGSLSSGRITSHTLDLDSTVDSDGNGNPIDDRDNQDTFSEKSGSPLRVFMTAKAQPRVVTFTVTDAATGLSDRVSLNVVFAAPPAASSSGVQPPDPNSLIVIEGNDMTARFTAKVPEDQAAGKHLLYEWDFGDHSRSLLTSPQHTYGLAGTYPVTLTVRDITSGTVILSAVNSVEIQNNAQNLSSSASSESSTASSASSKSSSASSGSKTVGTIGSLVMVGMIIVLLLAVAIGLYLLLTWIKRKTQGSLEKTIESMEKNIVKPDPKAVIDVKVEPLKLKKETPPDSSASTKGTEEAIIDREKSKTEFSTRTRDNAVPAATTGPVPSWLAKASTVTPSAPTPPPPPKPASAPTPVTAPSVPVVATPVAAPTPPTTPPSPPAAPKPIAEPITPPPDWLKPPVPKPETKPEPKPAPVPVIAPVATPPVPPTLKPTAAPTPVTPVQTPKPTTPSVPVAATPTPVAKVESAPPTPIAKAPEAPKPTPPPAPKPIPETPKLVAAEKKPSETPKDDIDPPIAIIQADSLTKN